MKEKKRKGARSVFSRLMKVIWTTLLIFVILGLAAGAGVYWKYHGEIKACKEKAQEIMAESHKNDFSKPADTRIFDSEGNLAGTINSGHFEYVSISDISRYLQDAYIAQEDHRFYEHHGIDWKGLIRAGLVLIKNKGEITQGGSTITQQVIKNTYLTQEKTFTRKITEIFAAPLMEEKYSKDQIMEFYCNTNFYGNRCYGVSEASRYYFDKEAKDLTVYEAATLAGLSNNPSRYDPVNHPEASRKKRNQILDNMEKNGLLSSVECSWAKSQSVTVAQVYTPGTKETYQISYAIHSAALELMKNEGFEFKYSFSGKSAYDAYKERYQEAYQEKSEQIRGGGFEIHTSLNSGLQAALQEIVDKKLSDFEGLQENGKYALQGAAVCVDNKTGYVVAIVGGRGTDDEYNRGFLSKRQPGSTIKPLIDYGPAFDLGFYYPSRQVDDHLFEDGPKNSSGRYHGYVSVREALNRSLNTVAWQVLQDIGVDTGIGYLEQLHMTGLSYLDNGNASMSIGGFTDGTSVADMAKGYAALANEGTYSSQSCITSLISQYEGELYQGKNQDVQVYTRDTAYMITDILKGTLEEPYGTGYGLGLSVPSAGKTGTTNSNKDTWFCGYTRYYTTAVWVGYDIPEPMPGVYGKTYAGAIWKAFMEQCHEGLPPEDWEMPSTVSLQAVDRTGEKSNRSTGKQDLFSDLNEERARADKGRWETEEKRRMEEAGRQRMYEAEQEASRQAAEQTAAALASVLSQLNGLTFKNSGTQDLISSAQSLLESLGGTSFYDVWKPQVDSAVDRAVNLPEEPSTEESQTREIGPGVSHGPGIPSGENGNHGETETVETPGPAGPGVADPGGEQSENQAQGPGAAE